MRPLLIYRRNEGARKDKKRKQEETQIKWHTIDAFDAQTICDRNENKTKQETQIKSD